MFNKGKACACACACVLFYFIPFFFLIRGDQEGKTRISNRKTKETTNSLNILPEEAQAGSTEELEQSRQSSKVHIVESEIRCLPFNLLCWPPKV